MKIYDCFTFYNEFELLELRLESLWDVVDKFVIVESNKTHTNKPKDYNFLKRSEEFRKYFPKIRYIAENDPVPFNGVGDWSIENHQRNTIARGLADAEPDDLIFISDLDEIPAPDVVNRILNNRQQLLSTLYLPLKIQGSVRNIAIPCQVMVPSASLLEISPIVMQQNMHYYYLNLINETFPWFGSILLRYKNLTTPQKIRALREYLPRATDGGWHFSYMGGVDRVIEKMTSIVEGNEELVKSGGKFIERSRVEKFTSSGSDPYDRTNSLRIQCKPCRIEDIKLPAVKDFVKKYPYFVKK